MIQFGGCVLDPASRELRRDDSSVAVAPKVFDLILALVGNRDRVVSMDELLTLVWGGRIVSESTIGSHINAARCAIGDDGKSQRLIRTVPRRGFRFVGTIHTDGPAPLLDTGSDRPGIAVLPFVDLTPDGAGRIVADGIADDVMDALARGPLLRVAARISGAWAKRQAADAKALGRELGVRYLVDGSARRSGSAMRLVIQLIDTTDGMLLWADRFDMVLSEDFAAQHVVAMRIGAAVVTRVQADATERAMRTPSEHPGAWAHYLRGTAYFKRGGRSNVARALAELTRATEIAPEFAAAHAAAAWCAVERKRALTMDDPAAEIESALRLAEVAVRLDPDDAYAITFGSYVLGHFGEDLDICDAHMERALRVGRGVQTLIMSAGQQLSAGRHEHALERIAEASAMPLSEADRVEIGILTCLASMMIGRVDDALRTARDAFATDPTDLRSLAVLAASHALLGRFDEAGRAMRLLRRHVPGLRVSGVGNWVHLRRPEDLETFAGALARAGLPR